MPKDSKRKISCSLIAKSVRFYWRLKLKKWGSIGEYLQIWGCIDGAAVLTSKAKDDWPSQGPNTLSYRTYKGSPTEFKNFPDGGWIWGITCLDGSHGPLLSHLTPPLSKSHLIYGKFPESTPEPTLDARVKMICQQQLWRIQSPLKVVSLVFCAYLWTTYVLINDIVKYFLPVTVTLIDLQTLYCTVWEISLLGARI